MLSTKLFNESKRQGRPFRRQADLQSKSETPPENCEPDGSCIIIRFAPLSIFICGFSAFCHFCGWLGETLNWSSSVSMKFMLLDRSTRPRYPIEPFREGLTPSPTCLLGQGGLRESGMRPVRQPTEGASVRSVSPPQQVLMEGFVFFGTAQYLQAYLDTDYLVRCDGGELPIRVGEKSRQVDQLLFRSKARTAVFITAWNPFSLQRGKQTNEQAHRRLAAALRLQRTPYLEGKGCGADGNWTLERSVLAFRVALRSAARLGRRFRQNAVIFVSYGKPAELLMLR